MWKSDHFTICHVNGCGGCVNPPQPFQEVSLPVTRKVIDDVLRAMARI